MIVSFDSPALLAEIEKAMRNSKTVEKLVTVGSEREGWVHFHSEVQKYAPEFPRPQGDLATHNEDPMLMYFTSGTSGYPKMVLHNFFQVPRFIFSFCNSSNSSSIIMLHLPHLKLS